MTRLKQLLPLLVLAIFIFAVWTIHNATAKYHYHEIIGYARAIPLKNLILAVLFTVGSYLVLTCYDLLAVRYLHERLERWRVMMASFISYSFSNNIGLSILTAGSLRYRLYFAWGLTAEQITKLVAFAVVTFWLGMLGVGGIFFTFFPPEMTAESWLSADLIRPMGMLFLAMVTAYLAALVLIKKPFQFLSWSFSLPRLSLGLGQVLVGTLDWCLAGCVLYVLLPDQIALSLPQLLSVFLLAQVVALISHVPGGLGVFESTILLFTPQDAAAPLLGTMLLYRAIYYLLPLALATSLLASTEIFQRRAAMGRIVKVLSQWSGSVTPQLLALMTFIGGAVLLFSGATPAIPARLEWLSDFFPLQFLEFSHFLGSLVGAFLLLLARGIQRRLDVAYILTLILLGAGSVLSLSKGADYEEALILLFMFVTLLPCHRYFYRKSSLLAETFSADWVLAVILILSCTFWLGMFSYKHVDYRDSLWWQFALHADAPRFMRAAVGAVVVLLLFAVAKLLRPAPPLPEKPDEPSLEKARKIVGKSHSTEANLALLGDKYLYFDPSDSGFIMYAIQGNSWVVMGDPVAPPDIARDLVWQFREVVEQHGGLPVFYEVSPDMLHLYLDMGLSLYKLGEEARVVLQEFGLEGKKRSGLRYTQRKLEKEGCRFEILPVEAVPEVLERLQFISDSWLKDKNSREKGFSLGFFSPEYLLNFPVGVVWFEGEIIAFANLWTSADYQEVSIDLMRYLATAPGGIMDYLFIHLMLWGREQGYHYFSLGMAPLAGLENRSFAPLWHRIGALVFRHGDHFYNFEGLRRYKEKFRPVWEPRYLACPGGLALPKVLTNTSALIAGGISGIFRK